ncbi:MAG TPA: hypothetical protein PKM70_07330 [Clostridia bacterium]|nr:hypothetical protein [Clostridia bacterium]
MDGYNNNKKDVNRRKLYSYMLRVEPKWETDIYREIRIDGSKTLEELYNIIIHTFEFDVPERQYMFSMDNIAFDEKGYYSPKSEDGTNKGANGAIIEDLNLEVNRRFLYLYDFGRNKLFEIIVKAKEPASRPHPPELLASVGVLDDFGKEYNPDEGLRFLFHHKKHADSFRVEKDIYCYHHNLLHISTFHFDILTGVLKDVLDPVYLLADDYEHYADSLQANMHRVFQILTPDALEILRWLYTEPVYDVVESITSRNLNALSAIAGFGFVDVGIEPGKGRDRLIFYLPKDSDHFAPYFYTDEYKEILKRTKMLDRAVKAIVELYGVVDLELLKTQLRELFDIDESMVEVVMHTIYPRVLEETYFMVNEFGTDYISKYMGDDLFSVLALRRGIDPKDYRKFTRKEARLVAQEGITGILPGYDELVHQLYSNTILTLDGVKLIAENIVRLRCGGYDNRSIIEYVERKLSCKWDNLTPIIRDLITNILDECPVHAFGGHRYKDFMDKNNGLSE